LVFAALLLFSSYAIAERPCGVYFTKIGCPVCAKVDPVFLGKWVVERPDAAVIEYVFASWYEENAVLMGEYNLSYGTGGSVPLVIKSEETNWAGIPGFATDEDIYNMLDQTFGNGPNQCLLKDKSVSFDDLDLNELPNKPKIWAGNRLLVKQGNGNVDSAFLKELLFSENLGAVLAASGYGLREVKAKPAPYSGGEIPFAQAVEIEGSWLLELREAIELPENVLPMEPNGNGDNVPADNPFIVPVAIILICLAALVVFIKVKSR